MPRVQVEWTLLNEVDDHFSYEDQGSYSLTWWLTVLQLLLAAGLIKSYLNSIKTHERYLSPHPLMLWSIAAQVSALALESIHLCYYSGNGTGAQFCDVLGKISQAFSEVIMSALLIMLANGWTLIYQEMELDDGAEIYLPIGAVVIMVHIIMSAMTFIDIDASHKYHDFAGVQGFIMYGLKMLIWLGFLWHWNYTNKKIERRSLTYFKMLLFGASAYLLAIPISITASWFYEPYERQYQFFLLSHVLMFGTNIALFFQVSYKGSTYQGANLDALDLLPMTFQGSGGRHTVSGKSD